MSVTVDVSPFEQALKEFRASLGPQEQSIFTQCQSPEELISHVQSLEIFKKSQKRGALMQHLSKFSRSLSPYFHVIGILVQSHPEFAALGWGAIRLVLQLASNFHEFFEKLTKTLLQISDAMPMYGKLASSFNLAEKDSLWLHEASSELITSLTKVYVDLFVFLQSVIRVFVKKNTSSRSSVIILNSLFWKPYDARFQDILESMKHHRELLRTELSFYGHQATHKKLTVEHEKLELELSKILGASTRQHGQCEDTRRRLDGVATNLVKTAQEINAMRKSLVQIGATMTHDLELLAKEIDVKLQSVLKASITNRLRMWLSAPEFARDLEIVRECRVDGTGGWFFRHQLFQQWMHTHDTGPGEAVRNEFGKSTIWVHGNPGFGKTTIAGAVIDELQAQAPVTSEVLYFFFRQEEALDNRTAAYRSLLTQIMKSCHDDELFDKFAFAMEHSPTSQPTGTCAELFELLRLCTDIIGPHHIVLDGIDECSDNESLILDLTKLGSQSNLILFSRPNVRLLQRNISQYQRIDIGKSNTDDIRKFLRWKLREMLDLDMFPEDASVENYTEHLTRGADGMFLWARLMIDYLYSERLSDVRRHSAIIAIGMPERLSEMYTRIIQLITQGYREDREFVKWIIMWLTFAKRTLTATELEESTKLLDAGPPTEPGRRGFQKTVVMTCGSLVEKATRGDTSCGNELQYFRFIHGTVKE